MPKGYKKHHRKPNYYKPVFGAVDEVPNTLKLHKEDIFKIQRPMGGSGPVLIYNQSRGVYAQMPMTPDLAVAMGNQYKIYVRAYITHEGILQVTEHLGWQPW